MTPDPLKGMLSHLSRLWFTAAKAREKHPHSARADRLERDARDLERRIDRHIDRGERQARP